MSTILLLIEEVPWLMTPATLITALLVITLAGVVNLIPFARIFDAGLSSEII